MNQQIGMDGFNYAIASILGAMLVVISMDAYLFFTEVLSRQWTSSGLVFKATGLVSPGSLEQYSNLFGRNPPTSSFGNNTQTLTITSGMPNVSMGALPCWPSPSSWSGASPMTSNLTRFYFEFDEDCRTGCFEGLSFLDVETIEADQYENELQSQDVSYTRIDL